MKKPAAAKKLSIDVWSDIACPWCWVGKRHLEAALEKFPHRDEVEIVWRAFELDPSAKRPQSDERATPYAARLAKKYGFSVEQAQKRIDEMTATAKNDGLDFRFDRVRPTNTFDAHRVIHLGAEKGVQDAVKERLLRAYMTDGELISDPEALARIGEEAGLDAEEIRATLASDRYAAEVREEEKDASELGIHGVPFFVVGGKYAIEGAQPAEILLRALTLAWAEAEKKPIPFGEGAVCGPDGC